MKQLPALIKNESGVLDITDGTKIIGGLLPVAGKEGYYTIRMGTLGGFYNNPLQFDDALQFLKQKLIISYNIRLNSIFTGANLIHKRKKS